MRNGVPDTNNSTDSIDYHRKQFLYSSLDIYSTALKSDGLKTQDRKNINKVIQNLVSWDYFSKWMNIWLCIRKIYEEAPSIKFFRELCNILYLTPISC